MSHDSLELGMLAQSWQLSLRARNMSKETLRAYAMSVTTFTRWCADTGARAELTRAAVEAYLSAQLDAGASAATARLRLAALQQFAGWCHEEGEIADNELKGIKTPKIDRTVTPALSAEQLRALLATCRAAGPINARDAALIRFMAETGTRAAETTALALTDVDVTGGTAIVHRGKGAKGRIVPFGAQTAAALDKWIRARRTLDGGTAALWLSARGTALSYAGLSRALKARADQANIAGFHLHVLRHTAATRWLAAGGSEQGLMAVAGWSSREMLDRYTSASTSQRAVAESRGLNLGDL
ncbi:tyrosine-type recombinase/integrase [Mycolicibacterium mucogenicum]|nr:tyrosine-type recombinase/integrase [Mycolicibacterium mucogenicum]